MGGPFFAFLVLLSSTLAMSSLWGITSPRFSTPSYISAISITGNVATVGKGMYGVRGENGYFTVATCSGHSAPTFTCVNGSFSHSLMNFSSTGVPSFLTNITSVDQEPRWGDNVAVTTTTSGEVFLAVSTRREGVTFSSVSPNGVKTPLGAPIMLGNGDSIGIVDSFVAAPNNFWFGVGNWSESHWDRKATPLVGVSRKLDGSAPIVVDTEGATWVSCWWVNDRVMCFSKVNQPNGPTRLWSVSDSTGAVTKHCESIGIPNAVFIISITFDSAAAQFVLLGYIQGSGSGSDPYVLFALSPTSCSASSITIKYPVAGWKVGSIWTTA